jgi:hypothetical protein
MASVCLCPGGGTGRMRHRQAGGVRSREGGHRTSGAARAPCTMISQAPAPRFGRSAGLLRPACLKHTWCGPALSIRSGSLAWTDEATAGEAPTCPEPRYPTDSLPGSLPCEQTARSPPSTRPAELPQATARTRAALASRLTLSVLSHVTTPRERAPPEQDTPHKHTIGLLSRDRIRRDAARMLLRCHSGAAQPSPEPRWQTSPDELALGSGPPLRGDRNDSEERVAARAPSLPSGEGQGWGVRRQASSCRHRAGCASRNTPPVALRAPPSPEGREGPGAAF